MPELSVTLNSLNEQLSVFETMRIERDSMFEPQDLPGRYGRVVNAVDQVLIAISSEAVLGGGWAVWRHGFVNRVTQDLDIVLPADKVDEFLRVARYSGFEVLQQIPGRWPKLRHKDSDIQVDLLPEGERPGTPASPAPTLIPSPGQIGGQGNRLRYITLPCLIELKLAAGRLKDQADVVELIRANSSKIESIRSRLIAVDARYVNTFDTLLKQAETDDSR